MPVANSPAVSSTGRNGLGKADLPNTQHDISHIHARLLQCTGKPSLSVILPRVLEPSRRDIGCSWQNHLT